MDCEWYPSDADLEFLRQWRESELDPAYEKLVEEGYTPGAEEEGSPA